MIPKYPKYKREEKLSAKLSLKDIDNIKLLYATGEFSQRDLGRKFNIAQGTIRIALMSKEDKKEHYRDLYARGISCSVKKRYGQEYQKKASKKVIERKKDLYPDEYRKWHSHQSSNHPYKKTKEYKEKMREYYKKYDDARREKRIEYNRAYYQGKKLLLKSKKYFKKEVLSFKENRDDR